jgi:hypothetical protein
METYRTWVRLFELLRYYSWIADRFHISTRVYQLQANGKDYDFSWLEKRLAALGFHVVFVTRRYSEDLKYGFRGSGKRSETFVQWLIACVKSLEGVSFLSCLVLQRRVWMAVITGLRSETAIQRLNCTHLWLEGSGYMSSIKTSWTKNSTLTSE